MSVAQLIGILLGAMLVIVPVIKWLIADYIKKSEKLEAMKAKNILKLEEEVSALRLSMNGLKNTISGHSSKIDLSSRSIKLISERIADAEQRIKHYSENMDKYVNKEVKEQIRTEIKQLTNQLIMVKSKNGKG